MGQVQRMRRDKTASGFRTWTITEMIGHSTFASAVVVIRMNHRINIHFPIFVINSGQLAQFKVKRGIVSEEGILRSNNRVQYVRDRLAKQHRIKFSNFGMSKKLFGKNYPTKVTSWWGRALENSDFFASDA